MPREEVSSESKCRHTQSLGPRRKHDGELWHRFCGVLDLCRTSSQTGRGTAAKVGRTNLCFQPSLCGSTGRDKYKNHTAREFPKRPVQTTICSFRFRQRLVKRINLFQRWSQHPLLLVMRSPRKRQRSLSDQWHPRGSWRLLDSPHLCLTKHAGGGQRFHQKVLYFSKKLHTNSNRRSQGSPLKGE